ncbi:hypothetical protein D3C78_973920 [compost metagenome]
MIDRLSFNIFNSSSVKGAADVFIGIVMMNRSDSVMNRCLHCLFNLKSDPPLIVVSIHIYMITGNQISACQIYSYRGTIKKKTFRLIAESSSLLNSKDWDLEWQTHLENRPIAKASDRYNHVSPEKQDIRSFSKLQVTKKNEKCCLQEKQKGHLGQVAGKGH